MFAATLVEQCQEQPPWSSSAFAACSGDRVGQWGLSWRRSSVRAGRLRTLGACSSGITAPACDGGLSVTTAFPSDAVRPVQVDGKGLVAVGNKAGQRFQLTRLDSECQIGKAPEQGGHCFDRLQTCQGCTEAVVRP